jgi:hypothetical protein
MCAEGTRARGRGARGAGTSRHGERTRRGVDEGAEPLGRTGTWRGGVWGPPTTGCTGVRGRRGARDGSRGCAGRKKEEGEGKRERGRGEGRGAHLGDPNSSDHRLQDLWHHEEREMGEGGRLLRRRIEMRERDQGMGRAHGEGQGARGARAELDWAGSGWARPHRGSKSRGTHNNRSEFNP